MSAYKSNNICTYSIAHTQSSAISLHFKKDLCFVSNIGRMIVFVFKCLLSLISKSHRSNSKISKQKGSSEGNGPLLGDIHLNELSLYLSACKFLDTALSFPPDKMQLFQM